MADNEKDILLDKDFDLSISNGDFDVGNSWGQDVEIIISLSKGELKSDPLLGVNLIEKINAKQGAIRAKQAIKLNLKRDEKTIKKVEISEGKINIIP